METQKKCCGRTLQQQVEKRDGVHHVVLEHRLDGVAVLLAAHVLVGGEMGDDIERALAPHHPGENRVAEADRVRLVVVRHELPGGAAQVAGELGQPVLVQVDDEEPRRLEGQQRADERGADRAGSPDDEHGAAGDGGAQLVGVGGKVGREQRLVAAGHVLRDEGFEVEHQSTLSTDSMTTRITSATCSSVSPLNSGRVISFEYSSSVFG